MKYSHLFLTVTFGITLASFAADDSYHANNAKPWGLNQRANCKDLRKNLGAFGARYEAWLKNNPPKDGASPYTKGNVLASDGNDGFVKGLKKLEDLAGQPIDNLGGTSPKNIPCEKRLFSGFDLEKSHFGFTQGFSKDAGDKCTAVPNMIWKSSRGQKLSQPMPHLSGWNVGAFWCSDSTVVMALEGSQNQPYLQKGLAFWNLRTGEIEVAGDPDRTLTGLLSDLEPWRVRVNGEDVVELKGPDGWIGFSRVSHKWQNKAK